MPDDIKILLGNCFDLMSDIPDGSVDLVLCDLPYGTTACKWDTILPFDQLWGHYIRVTKPSGTMVFTASQPFTSKLVLSNLKLFKYELIYEKTRATGFLDCKFRPMKAHESIIVFSKAGCSNGSKPAMCFNPQKVAGDPYDIRRHKKSLVTRSIARSNVERTDSSSKDGLRYPRSVLKFTSEQTGLHPTQKPLLLFEYLIKTYSNPGEMVLDNCVGVGTTLLACRNTGRKGIGIEIDPDYYKIALERLDAIPE